jgi:DNA-binding Xre family transcriptional regulator
MIHKPSKRRKAYMIRLKVKEVAISKGFNMSSLSRASDVHFNTIKRMWTRPYLGVNLDTLQRIAKALGVTVNDLFEDVPNER